MKRKLIFCLSVNLILLFASSSAIVSAQTKQRVHFAANASNATIKGVVRGYAYIDYIVGAHDEHRISVELSAPATVPVFTIFPPNGGSLEGATQQNDFSGTLSESGDYVIRVGLMRAAKIPAPLTL